MNPVAGVKEVGDYLESIEKRYAAINQPALVMQADKNPVVNPKGSQQVYENIGSAEKEFCLLNYDRHILVNGDGAEKVFQKIGAFVGNI
jgi:esterase/lipase